MNLNIMTVADAAKITEAVKASPKPANTIADEGRKRATGKTPQVAADDLYGIGQRILRVGGIRRTSTSIVLRQLMPYRTAQLLAD